MSAFGTLQAPATTVSLYLYSFLRRIEKLYMFLYNESGIGPIFPAHSENRLQEACVGDSHQEAARIEKHDTRSVVVRGSASGFAQEIVAGSHRMAADEPVSAGGTDRGPTPYDFLLAALGACTSITVGMYARRKGWPLEEVTVTLRHSRIHASDCADCETRGGMLDRIERDIHFAGSLTNEQRSKLVEIANKCPVHRTLESEIVITTSAV